MRKQLSTAVALLEKVPPIFHTLADVLGDADVCLELGTRDAGALTALQRSHITGARERLDAVRQMLTSLANTLRADLARELTPTKES